MIAGGWSLKGIDFGKIPGFKIGVNDSAWRAETELGVTMDRLFFEGRFKQLDDRYRPPARGAMYIRAGIDKAGLAPATWVQFDCDNESAEMSRAWAPRCRLNGMNSGICGINLAFRQNPERVILWGFDMCRNPATGAPYYHEPYPWGRPLGNTTDGKFMQWAKAFADIRRQFDAAGIELINASPGSAINSIKKVDPSRLLT